MKWLLITDTHFGCRSDSKVFHALFRKFYTGFFLDQIRENDITAVFMLGDFFDRRKMINFETLKLAREVFFQPLAAMGMPVYMITGNHDVMYKNTNSVNSLDLLVSEQGYKNFKIFSHPETIVVDSVPVLMLPWINSENYNDSMDAVRNSEARYVFSHLEMKGFEYHRGMMSERGHCDADLLARYDAVFSGHYHHRSSRGNIHYLGTPYEMTWADYGDPKGVHVFDGKLKFIENPEKIFIKLTYDDANSKAIDLESLSGLESKHLKVHVVRKEKPILFEQFVDKIMSFSPTDLMIIDETNNVTSFSEVDIETEDTLSIVKRFVEDDLQTDLSKERLLRQLETLYVDAHRFGED
jgi:DNA repair exonuclease SbcCD nuclease subunit